MRYKIIIFFVFLSSYPIFGQDLEQVGEADPVDLSGSLSLQTGYYNTSLSYNRQDPYAFSLMGSAVLSLYGWQIPFNVSYANQQFNSGNPFQQFGLSPRYRWMQLHLGYSSMSFSPYTLNNHTFLGGGIELTPGNFRFGVMYGRLREKQQQLEGQYSSFHIPAYKRMGYGVKLGYGTSANFIDFILFKASDDTTSLQSSENLSVLPSENLVIGVSGRLQLFKALSWEFHTAGSAYTRNMYSRTTEDGEEYIPGLITSLYQPRISSRFTYAGHTSLHLQLRGFSIKGTYKRIQPGFASMGLYYITGDKEQYTIAPSLRLFQGRVSISGSLGLENDNVMNTKAVTTHRQIGSANVNWNTRGAFGLSMQYSNYQMDQSAALLDLNDTTKIAMVNRNISVIPRLTFRQENKTHQITLFSNSQGLTDYNDFTSDMSETSTYTGNLNYSFRNRDNFFNTKTGLNLTRLNTALSEIRRYGLTLGVGKGFFEDKLTTNFRTNYSRNEVDGASAGYILGFHFNSGYNLPSGHAFSLMLKVTKNETENRRFSENMARVQYTYRF